MQKICYINKEKIENKYVKNKKYCTVRDHCHYEEEYRGAVHTICNLKYSVSKKICIAFHKGSNYDYRFIIEELAEEFKKQFTCLGENTKKIHNLYSSNRQGSYRNFIKFFPDFSLTVPGYFP